MVNTIKSLKEAGRLVNKITEEAENQKREGFKITSVLDKVILNQFEHFSIPKLEDLRFNLNKVIKKKKEIQRQKEFKKKNDV